MVSIAEKKIKKAKKNEWSSHDVYWYAPNKEIVIAYSTVAASNLIEALVSENPNISISNLYNAINYDAEAQKVLQAYIDNGFGETNASSLFT